MASESRLSGVQVWVNSSTWWGWVWRWALGFSSSVAPNHDCLVEQFGGSFKNANSQAPRRPIKSKSLGWGLRVKVPWRPMGSQEKERVPCSSPTRFTGRKTEPKGQWLAESVTASTRAMTQDCHSRHSYRPLKLPLVTKLRLGPGVTTFCKALVCPTMMALF